MPDEFHAYRPHAIVQECVQTVYLATVPGDLDEWKQFQKWRRFRQQELLQEYRDLIVPFVQACMAEQYTATKREAADLHGSGEQLLCDLAAAAAGIKPDIHQFAAAREMVSKTYNTDLYESAMSRSVGILKDLHRCGSNILGELHDCGSFIESQSATTKKRPKKESGQAGRRPTFREVTLAKILKLQGDGKSWKQIYALVPKRNGERYAKGSLQSMLSKSIT